MLPWKTIGHLYYATPSFVHHFVAIGEFKLELVRKRPIWVKIDDFFSRVTLQFDVWPWKTIGHLFYATLKNNRAPLICYFKLCASFRSYWWIQTWVTVRKRPIWVNIHDFLSRVTLQFDVWHWKNNRAPLLCDLKLCESFRSHWSFQTGECPIWVKFDDF